MVTVSVTGPLDGAMQHLRHSVAVEVGDRRGHCGVSGSPRMLVPLPRGLVLDVSAPCALAAPLAEKALGRLGA